MKVSLLFEFLNRLGVHLLCLIRLGLRNDEIVLGLFGDFLCLVRFVYGFLHLSLGGFLVLRGLLGNGTLRCFLGSQGFGLVLLCFQVFPELVQRFVSFNLVVDQVLYFLVHLFHELPILGFLARKIRLFVRDILQCRCKGLVCLAFLADGLLGLRLLLLRFVPFHCSFLHCLAAGGLELRSLRRLLGRRSLGLRHVGLLLFGSLHCFLSMPPRSSNGLADLGRNQLHLLVKALFQEGFLVGLFTHCCCEASEQSDHRKVTCHVSTEWM
mmetsp:Transcript_128942/g.181885  ORF Transcript_128942/g.181885 Transcript_128942/m.181885 type:complete len:268 (-) Transcript_128942:57-860(-)